MKYLLILSILITPYSFGQVSPALTKAKHENMILKEKLAKALNQLAIKDDLISKLESQIEKLKEGIVDKRQSEGDFTDEDFEDLEPNEDDPLMIKNRKLYADEIRRIDLMIADKQTDITRNNLRARALREEKARRTTEYRWTGSKYSKRSVGKNSYEMQTIGLEIAQILSQNQVYQSEIRNLKTQKLMILNREDKEAEKDDDNNEHIQSKIASLNKEASNIREYLNGLSEKKEQLQKAQLKEKYRSDKWKELYEEEKKIDREFQKLSGRIVNEIEPEIKKLKAQMN